MGEVVDALKEFVGTWFSSAIRLGRVSRVLTHDIGVGRGCRGLNRKTTYLSVDLSRLELSVQYCSFCTLSTETIRLYSYIESV